MNKIKKYVLHFVTEYNNFDTKLSESIIWSGKFILYGQVSSYYTVRYVNIIWSGKFILYGQVS